MIKVSVQRSSMRRMLLTKAADEYSDMLNSYAGANRGLVGAGTRLAVNDNLRKSGYPPHGTSRNPYGLGTPLISGAGKPLPKGHVKIQGAAPSQPVHSPYGLGQPLAPVKKPAPQPLSAPGVAGAGHRLAGMVRRKFWR